MVIPLIIFIGHGGHSLLQGCLFYYGMRRSSERGRLGFPMEIQTPWIGLSPSVILAPIFAVGLPSYRFFSCPITSSVSDLWIAILVAVFIRGARTKRPARLWWGLLLPLALLFLKEEYYTSLALRSLGTLWAMMGPISFSSRTGRRISVSLPIALLLIVAAIGGRLFPRMTAGQWFPQYRWFQKETHVLPAGHVWVPLTQGGVFTGGLIVQVGWHVAKWGPGHFQLWLPN